MRRLPRVLWVKFRRQPLIHVLGAMVLVSTLLSAISSAAAYRAQRHADEAIQRVERETDDRLLDACLQFNRTREDNRHLTRQGNFDAVEAIVEVVVEAGTTPEEQALIARLREILSEKQANMLSEHAADDLDCSNPEGALQLQGR